MAHANRRGEHPVSYRACAVADTGGPAADELLQTASIGFSSNWVGAWEECTAGAGDTASVYVSAEWEWVEAREREWEVKVGCVGCSG